MQYDSRLPAALVELIEQRGNSRFETSWRFLSHFSSLDFVSLVWVPLLRPYLSKTLSIFIQQCWVKPPINSLAKTRPKLPKFGVAPYWDRTKITNLTKNEVGKETQQVDVARFIVVIPTIISLTWSPIWIPQAMPAKQLWPLRIKWVWFYRWRLRLTF